MDRQYEVREVREVGTNSNRRRTNVQWTDEANPSDVVDSVTCLEEDLAEGETGDPKRNQRLWKEMILVWKILEMEKSRVHSSV